MTFARPQPDRPAKAVPVRGGHTGTSLNRTGWEREDARAGIHLNVGRAKSLLSRGRANNRGSIAGGRQSDTSILPQIEGLSGVAIIYQHAFPTALATCPAATASFHACRAMAGEERAGAGSYRVPPVVAAPHFRGKKPKPAIIGHPAFFSAPLRR
jgi:hypothetical protein